VTAPFRISDRSLEALEWGTIQAALAERARTPLGRKLALDWTPTRVIPTQAELQANAVIDLRDLKEELGSGLPLGDVPDLSDVLKRVTRTGTISLEEFRALVSAQRSVQSLLQFLARYGVRRDSLRLALNGLDLADAWTRKHFGLLDAQGEIVDTASPDLGALRQLARELHQKIRRRLEEFLQSPKLAELMQDFYVTVRDGRYVLPIKNNYKGRVPGIIHDVSNSEQTLFIEPEEVVDWNNQLKITEREIEKEIERILALVVLATQPFVGTFERNQEILARADLMSAGLEFLLETHSELCVPRRGEHLSYEGLKHPLLCLKRTVVANDLAWKQALLLTGPNTGGKTVLLKGVGLSLCLSAAGFPVTAKNAEVPRDLSGLFVDIGDEQSLEQNLSTFSAHLLSLKDMIEHAQPGDLLLLDEIATGTSPEEGQPLAQAVIEDFLDRGVRAMVTTHYGALKQFALTDERCRIAAMAFDTQSQRPTYEVILDIPGESSAFETAASVGFPARLLERARRLRGEASQDVTKALKRLEDVRREFQEKEARLETELDRARKREEQAQRSIEQYSLKQKDSLSDESKKLLKQLTEIRDDVAQAVKGASVQDLAGGGAHKLFQKISDAAQEIRSRVHKEAEAQSSSSPLAPEELQPGCVVDIEGLGTGTILELPKGDLQAPAGQFTVQVGELKTRVARVRLTRPTGEQARAYRSNRASQDQARERKAQSASGSASLLQATGSKICDVRGKNVDDAMRRIETALNELTRYEEGIVTIIHGHGSERLKDSIRSYLTSKRDDLVFRPGSWPGEGGDGVTLVERAR
jgi:DNA mismatch repair protein MutS2